MGEFFKEWRRKVGVITLVMACVFMSGWVRSEIISEIFVLPINIRDAISIVSSHGRFSVEMEIIQSPKQPIWSTFPVSKIQSAFAGKENQWPDLWSFNKLHGALVPYWLIVIPLIVISFCLLVMPCKSAQKVARLWGVDFKPLRRKLGGATVLVACVFIGVWVRSQFNEDRFSIPVDNGMPYSIGLVLLHDGIGLSRFKLSTIRGVQSVVEDTVLLVIPHWYIVLPLTLVALFLILSKPYPSNQKKIFEPIPEKMSLFRE